MGKAGKAKKSRSKVVETPIGRLSNEQEVVLQQAVPVLERISSHVAAFRRAGCDAIASLISEQKGSLELLLREGLIEKLMPCICDTDLYVCSAATGAFRNLSIAGGAPMCELMIRKDILTLLMSQLSKGTNRPNKIADSFALLTQILALLTNLGETNELAIRSLSRSEVLVVIMECLRIDVCPIELCIEAAQLLLLLTEDNVEVAVPLMTHSPWAMHINQLATHPEPHLRVLAAGIMVHCLRCESASSSAPSAVNSASFQSAVNVLAVALDIDVVALAAQLPSLTASVAAQVEASQKLLAESAESKDAHPDFQVSDFTEADQASAVSAAAAAAAADADVSDVMEQDLERAPPTDATTLLNAALDAEPWAEPLTAWRRQAAAVQTAIELLTNLCTLDDMAEQIDDSGWDDDSQDAVASSSSESPVDVPASFQAALNAGILPKLLARSVPAPAEMNALSESLPVSETQNVINSVNTVTIRALTALTNIILVLPLPALGDLFPVWSHALELTAALSSLSFPVADFQQLQVNPDCDLVALGSAVPASLGALHAASKLVWCLLRKHPALPISKAHVSLLVPIARGGPSAAARLHALGSLALVATARQHLDLIFVLGSVLLQGLSDVSLPVVAEALNGIFDLFSEDGEFTDIIRQLELLPALAAFLPHLTQRISSEQHSLDKELVSRLKESRLNLSRFLKYKPKHL